MPIRFVCPTCRQLLSVGSRKVGSAIACPRCGAGTIVPAESMVGAGGKEDRQDWDHTTPVGGFEDVNELLGDAPVIQPVIRTPVPTQPAGYGNGYRSPTSGSNTSSAPSSATLSSAAAGNLLLVSRTAIYAQAALFVLVAIVAFAGGYYVGRDQAPEAATVDAATAERPRVHGIIEYDEGGKKAADDGAVVIILPASAPAKKLGVRGLRPDDTHDETAASNLRDAGGDVGRADKYGAYELVVSGGEHLVLIISHHATKSAGLDDDDLARLASYFDVAPDLVGTYRYELLSETLSGNNALLNHTFGKNPAK